MVRKRFRQEDEVTSQDMNNLFGDSVPGYATEAERTADWQTPISDLALPSQRADIPLGQQSVVGGGAPFYGAWNGAAWVPWNRHTPAETGLIQVAVGDVVVEESVSGTVTARFPVRLVNARADINTWTDPTFHITAGDLGSRVIRCSARAVEYDPRPYGERTPDISYTEAVAGSDFLPTVRDITFLPSDSVYQQFVEVTIFSNPEDRGALPDGRPRVERFQLELYNFRGVKPLKDIGIGSITSQQLPQLRLEDVTIATDRLSSTDPNIGAKTYTIPVRLSQAPGTDINLQVFTEDGTAVATAGQRDYDAFRKRITFRAGSVTPTAPLTGTLPNQLLEATEHFFVTARPVPGNQPPVIFTKPRARVTITGRALLPRVSAPTQVYGPGWGINPLSPRSDRPTSVYLRLICDPAPTAETGPVRVRYRTDDDGGYASAGQVNYHYLPASGAVTFGVGETSKLIQVNTDWTYRSVPDSPRLYERASDVQIRLILSLDPGDRAHSELASTSGYIQLAGGAGTTAAPVFTAVGATVDEGRPAIVNAMLNIVPNVGADASVDWRILTTGVFGNAVPGVHYLADRTSGTFTFPGGGRDITRSIRVRTISTAGATIPNPRFFTIQFQNPMGCTISTRNVVVTINEAGIATDRPLVTANDLTITEPAGTGQNYGITLVLGDKIAGNTQPYFVDFATKEGTALSGTNYVSITRTRASWTATGTDNTHTVVINILNNNITTPKEFYLDLGERVSGGSHSGNLELAGADRYVIRILPRTAVTTALPSMSAADVRVDDDAGTARITATLDGPAPEGASVDYVTQDGTGQAGTHYTQSTGTLEFPAGGRTATLDIPVFPDNRNTNDHTFRILWSGEQQITLTDTRTDVTIVNTGSVRPPPEPEADPTITIADTRVQIPATGTATATLTISASRTATEAISGTISTFPGTAQPGTHYTALSAQAWTIPAGSGSVDVPVTIRAATITEDVAFTATLVLADDAPASIGDSTATITITPAAEATQLYVDSLDLTGSSRTGTINVVVRRTGDDQAITFDLETINGTARSGLAFTAITRRQYSMGAGVNRLEVPVSLITPTTRTPRQTFILRASNLSAGTIEQADGTITLPAYTPAVRRVPEVVFANAGAVIEPGPGSSSNSVFTFTISEAFNQAISGSFRTQNINSAVAGTDYTATTATWTIGEGSRSTRVLVPILNDNVSEGRERFRAIAGIDSGNARFDNGELTDTATGLIDDRPADVSISVGDVTAMERGGMVAVPVTRTGVSTQAVNFRAETFSTDSATAGEDYVPLRSWNGVILANRNVSFVDVRTLLRGAQGIEHFGVRLSNPRNAVIDDGVARVTLPATGRVPVLLSAPAIGVKFTADAVSSYATLTVLYPVVIPWPVDEDITGSFLTGLSASFDVPPFLGAPLQTYSRFNESMSGQFRIPAGSTSAVVPALVYRRRVGTARWITITAAVLVGAVAALATTVGGLLAFYGGTQGLALTIGAGGVSLAVGQGLAATWGITGVTVLSTAGTIGALSAGAALGGGLQVLNSRLDLADSELVALGDIGLSADNARRFANAFDSDRLVARGTISSLRGPVIARAGPSLTAVTRIGKAPL